jgi:spore germination protein GerM
VIHRLRWPAVTVLFVLLLSSCGVGSQSDPEVIPPGDVPFGLARQTSETSTTTGGATAFTYTLYFLSGDELRPVVRRTDREPTPTTILRDLAHGFDDEVSGADLRTLVPPDTAIDRVTVEDGVATVSLGGRGATRVATDRQALGIAQVVYTATELPGVDRVRFRVDGRAAEVPRGDGTLTSHAVGRTDYPAVG